MSTEENRQLAYRFDEEWNRGNREGVFAFFDEDFVDHMAQPGLPPGHAGLKQRLGWFFDAFPDSHLNLQVVVAEADLVAECGTLSGTHTGSLFGVPPTVKKATVSYFDVHRFKDGKIVETWHLEDIFGAMRQLGALPLLESSRG